MRFPVALALVLAACACPPDAKKPTTTTTGAGSASAGATPCEAQRAHVAELYRVEAQAKDPKRVDEAVADNTAMVMTECAKDPAARAACLAAATSAADLEKTCLVPLDDEGTEGKSL